MASRDDVLEAIRGEIARLGGLVDKIRHGKGGHRVVYWSRGAFRAVTTVPRTNGDWRQVQNALAGIRRTLNQRELGR